MIYYFILGKNPALSAAELSMYLDSKGYTYSVVFRNNKAIGLRIEQDFDVEHAKQTLAGTVKIGVILQEIKILQLSDFVSAILHEGVSKEKKVFFGYSIYTEQNPKNVEKALKGIAKEAKSQLVDQGYKARWVSSRNPDLSSVIVKKEKLLENGADVCYIFSENIIYQGRTLAIQPFEEFAFRDFKRPKADAKSGMLPPKIARIMINLVGMDKETILDPFCGSGTVAGEAYDLGYKHIYCSDISEKAVLNSKANLEWLEQERPQSDASITIIQDPVEELSQSIPASSIDAIVTEPYLGPPLGKSFKHDPAKIIEELESLYMAAFKTYASICKPNAVVVMVWPFIEHKGKSYAIDIVEAAQDLGFQVDNTYTLLEGSSLDGKGRENVPMYYREGQRVKREIWRFRFKK